MTKEELEKEVEEYLHNNYCCKGSYCGFNTECKEGVRIRCSEFDILKKHLINFGESRKERIAELTDELKALRESIKDYGAGCYENGLRNGKRKLEAQIERMKCCGNCRFSENDKLNGTFCHREGCFVVASAKCKLWEN